VLCVFVCAVSVSVCHVCVCMCKCGCVWVSESVVVCVCCVYEVMGKAAASELDYERSLNFSLDSLLMLKKIYGEDAVHSDIATSLNNVGER